MEKERIRRLLSSRVPVRKASPALTEASVLVPLFASDGASGPSVWLLRRSDDLRVHGGQVALPGGKKDASDPTPLATALREAHEEIGLEPESVDVLGALDDYATGTGFVITPYVGWIADGFVPKPLVTEVSRVFAVPLELFRGEPSIREYRDAQNNPKTSISFEIGDETVWGLTAWVLRDLACRLA